MPYAEAGIQHCQAAMDESVPQVQLIENKVPWVHYTEALAEFEESKKRRQTAEQALAERKQEYEDSLLPERCVANTATGIFLNQLQTTCL